jgi:hypothetical protein
MTFVRKNKTFSKQNLSLKFALIYHKQYFSFPCILFILNVQQSGTTIFIFFGKYVLVVKYFPVSSSLLFLDNLKIMKTQLKINELRSNICFLYFNYNRLSNVMKRNVSLVFKIKEKCPNPAYYIAIISLFFH